MNVRNFLKASLMLGAALAFGSLQAQPFPNKTVNLVVPYPAGGASDFVARTLQPGAAAKLGQTMIIDNVGGAGGSIGLSKLINSPADGYTTSLATPMELVLAPLAIQGVKFKPEDFKLIAQVVNTTTILVVRPNLNVKSIDELVAMAKKNAAQPMAYGSVDWRKIWASHQSTAAACALQRHRAFDDRFDGRTNRHGVFAHGRSGAANHQ